MARYEGDPSRRIRVELPPTFEDLEHLCLTSFGMVGPVTIYKDGVAAMTREDYNNIQSGENFVVVDSRGNAVDAKNFFVSTYDRDFTAKPLPPRSAAPPGQPWQKLPDNRSFRTTEDDFQQWPLERRQQPEIARRPDPIPFNGTTEHRQEYSPKKLPPRQPIPDAQRYQKLPDSRDFAPESSRFQPWELPKRQQPSPAQRPDSIPFAARSSHQDDYPAHPVQPRASPPKEQWQPNGIRFNAKSTTQSDYPAWDLPKRQHPPAANRPGESLPFTATTTAQDAFRVRYNSLRHVHGMA